MKVSVIIPVYNTAEYLPQCLDSVTAQSHSDLEIIAVDDGSTDSSAEILQRHAATDGRLRVISQPNRGVSAARNAALDAATGEYVVFVDSDDCIDRDHISLMAGLARPDNAVFTGTVRLDGGHKSTVDVPELEGLTTREAIIALRRAQYFGWVYNNIFSMEIIRREGLRFDESMRIHEDEEFKARYMRHVSSTLHGAQEQRRAHPKAHGIRRCGIPQTLRQSVRCPARRREPLPVGPDIPAAVCRGTSQEVHRKGVCRDDVCTAMLPELIPRKIHPRRARPQGTAPFAHHIRLSRQAVHTYNPQIVPPLT